MLVRRSGRSRGARMNISLISPKGPLYRHRGGIFRRSLRYQPLTLTTLAALVPPELEATLSLIDEGIADVDPQPRRRPRRPDRHHRHRAARLRAGRSASRARGITVVLGGPHVTLVPDDAQPHADAIVVGYAEDTWPQLLRDFAAGRLRPRYDQAPDLSLAGRPFPRRELLPGAPLSHQQRLRGDARLRAQLRILRRARPRGDESRSRSRSRTSSRTSADMARGKLIFVDLNLIADRDYATRLFKALIPLNVAVVRPVDGAARRRSPVAGARGAQRLPRAADGLRVDLAGEPARSRARASIVRRASREIVALLHAHGIAVYGCFVFGLDDDTPDVFLETARFAVEAGIDLPRFAVVDAVPGHGAPPAARARGPDPHAELGAVRRPARRLPAGADERRRSCSRAPSAHGSTRTRPRRSRAACVRRRRRRGLR